MALNQNSILLKRLQQANLLDPQLTSKLLQEKSHQYQTIADLLIGEKLIQSKILAEAAAIFTLHSSLDLDFFDINAIPEQLRNEKLIRKHHILPLSKRHKTLFLCWLNREKRSL